QAAHRPLRVQRILINPREFAVESDWKRKCEISGEFSLLAAQSSSQPHSSSRLMLTRPPRTPRFSRARSPWAIGQRMRLASGAKLQFRICLLRVQMCWQLTCRALPDLPQTPGFKYRPVLRPTFMLTVSVTRVFYSPRLMATSWSLKVVPIGSRRCAIVKPPENRTLSKRLLNRV